MILDCLINFLLNLFKNKEYIQQNTDGVLILDVDQKEDIKNIKNYLVHHFDDSTVDFMETFFKQPVYIKYKINNDIFKIALYKLSKRRTEPVITGKKILCASKNNEGVNITDLVTQFYGPNRNFYSDNTDSLTLKENKYFVDVKIISTLNMLGQKNDIII